MNRREALAALTALPAVTRLSTVELKPSDVLVVECEGVVSASMGKAIKDGLKRVWPKHRVVILSGGLKLKIVSG